MDFKRAMDVEAGSWKEACSADVWPAGTGPEGKRHQTREQSRAEPSGGEPDQPRPGTR